ncbi:hypothetical protein R3P38DRAFT_3554160 [Favolaschia claudopus]|uniref:DUF6535 domain-containing protein n=1 Tax=Favolaschia claudopus TaxID=2862362 RepID=A0AAW0B104_9AGAR
MKKSASRSSAPDCGSPVLSDRQYIRCDSDWQNSFNSTDSYDTAGAKIWSVYVSEAEKYDRALVDSWKSDMEGLLIFVSLSLISGRRVGPNGPQAGLFSAILTAFLIESYKTLTPDSGDDMKTLLIQISTQLSGIANGTSVDLPAPESFVPPTSSLVCNLLWFISLGLSLSCALVATLVEQWARDFKYKTERHSAPVRRARIFSYLYYGLKRFNVHVVVEIIPLLLHSSLILFFAGLVAFLVPVNKAVMIIVIIMLGIVVIAYTMLTVFPLFSRQSPYQTPLSAGVWRAIQLIQPIWRSTPDRCTEPDTMIDAMNIAALEDSDQRMDRDCHALSWTVKSLSDDVELEPFLEGIVDALATTSSNRTLYDEPIRRLLQRRDVRLISRVDEFLRHSDNRILTPETRIRRQLVAMKCLWAMAIIPVRRSGPFARHPIELEPLPLDQLLYSRFPFPSELSYYLGPPVVWQHELSTLAVLRMNLSITATDTISNTVTFLNNHQLSGHEEIPSYIREPLRVLASTCDLWYIRIRIRPSSTSSRWAELSYQTIKDLCFIANSFPYTDVSGKSMTLVECLAALNSLHKEFIRLGREDFLDFMVYAARLESPPYLLDETKSALFWCWHDRREAVSPNIAAKIFNACNTVIDSQCNVHARYQHHVDNILATLLDLVSDFQKSSPNSNVSLPSNLSAYLSKPYFDPSKSVVFRKCDRWWLCSCLTMELTTKLPHVRSDSSEQILMAMWEVAAKKVASWDRSRLRLMDPSYPHVPTHPSQSMLAALCEITDNHKAISIIPLVQTAVLNDSSDLRLGPAAKVPAYPTLADKGLTLTILDMRVAILSKFIHDASNLQFPPYKVNETMSSLTSFVPDRALDGGVSPPQQLDFANNWKAAFEHDNPEGFHATMVEVIASCSLLQTYWDHDSVNRDGTEIGLPQSRWLDDHEAVRVFLEGVDMAERREEITPKSRTRLAAIRESLMTVLEQVEGGIAKSPTSTIDLEALNISW